jgi:hypothetical protein
MRQKVTTLCIQINKFLILLVQINILISIDTKSYEVEYASKSIPAQSYRVQINVLISIDTESYAVDMHSNLILHVGCLYKWPRFACHWHHIRHSKSQLITLKPSEPLAIPQTPVSHENTQYSPCHYCRCRLHDSYTHHQRTS